MGIMSVKRDKDGTAIGVRFEHGTTLISFYIKDGKLTRLSRLGPLVSNKIYCAMCRQAGAIMSAEGKRQRKQLMLSLETT